MGQFQNVPGPSQDEFNAQTQAIANLSQPQTMLTNVVAGDTHNTIGFVIPKTAKTAKIVKIAPLGQTAVNVNLSLTIASSVAGMCYIVGDQTGTITDGKNLISLARYYSTIAEIELTY